VAAAVWLVMMGAVVVSGAEPSWRFVVCCDSRGPDNGVNFTILREIAEEAVRHGAEFVLFPGDLVTGMSISSPAEFESELRTWLEAMRPVYDVNIAVYAGRGNHEVWDASSEQGGGETKDNFTQRWLKVFGSEADPRWRLPDNGPAGEKYMSYAVEHKNALIVMLDQYGGLEQRLTHRVNQSWLNEVLAGTSKPHVFVAGHEPAFRAFPREVLDVYPQQRDAFWESLRRAGARVYFCGHDHFYDRAHIDDGDGDPNNDLHQLIVGLAGAPPYYWWPPYLGNNSTYVPRQEHHCERYGYLLVEVEGLRVQLIYMARTTNNVSAAGRYEPNDVWSYEVDPAPLVLLRPVGGERLVAGNDYEIVWKSIEPIQVERVVVEYSSDNGTSWEQIAVCPNVGGFMWQVPEIDSAWCLLRVRDADEPSRLATTERPFTIFRCQRELAADLNGDCYVNTQDMAILAEQWLWCGNPFDPSCQTNP